METITLTILNTPSSLRANAAVLIEAADSYQRQSGRCEREEAPQSSMQDQKIVSPWLDDTTSDAPPPPEPPAADNSTGDVPPPPEPPSSNPGPVNPKTGKPEDPEGVVWDERIHAETQSCKKDGCWKLKRGIDKDLAAKVLLEQKGTQPAALAPPPPPVATPAEWSPPAPPAPPSEPADEEARTTLSGLVRKITTNGVNHADAIRICRDLGLENGLTQLNANKELIPLVHDALFPPAK